MNKPKKLSKLTKLVKIWYNLILIKLNYKLLK